MDVSGVTLALTRACISAKFVPVPGMRVEDGMRSRQACLAETPRGCPAATAHARTLCMGYQRVAPLVYVRMYASTIDKNLYRYALLRVIDPT